MLTRRKINHSSNSQSDGIAIQRAQSMQKLHSSLSSLVDDNIIDSQEKVQKLGKTYSSPGPASDCKTNSLEQILSSQETILSSPCKRTKSEDEYESITLIKQSKAMIFSSSSFGYFDDCVFVGCVYCSAFSPKSYLLLFQKGANLNYLQYYDLLYESFHQIIILNFGVSPDDSSISLTASNLNLCQLDDNA